MGTHKKILNGGYTKAKKERETDTERLLRLSQALGDALYEHLPFLMQDVLDDENPVVELKFRMREDQSPLCHAKRRTIEGTETIAFGTGDDLVQALIGLEMRIATRGYVKAKKWNDETKQFE